MDNNYTIKVYEAVQKINKELEESNKDKLDYHFNKVFGKYEITQGDESLVMGSQRDLMFFLTGLKMANKVGYKGVIREVKNEIDEYFLPNRVIELEILDIKDFSSIFYAVKNFKMKGTRLNFFYRVFVGYSSLDNENGVKTFEGHTGIDIKDCECLDEVFKKIAYAINDDLLFRFKRNKNRAQDYYNSMFLLTSRDIESFGKHHRYTPKVLYKININYEDLL